MRLILIAAMIGLTSHAFAAFDYSKPPIISADGHQLLVNDQPLRGMFVMWHAGKTSDEHGEEFYRSEFRKIRDLGFTGVHFEIGWHAIEPENGVFDFESFGLDKVINWAAEEGLWIALLLTPHYTPDWVFEKHGDVRMKTPDGKDARGSFLTISPSSPAVDDQIAFQQKAIQHYEQFNNIIAFFLTNEQAYGSHWVDHSRWARESWVEWLGQDADLPKSEEDEFWGDWLLFRRQELNRYFNRLHEGASSAQSRFIPIGHKFVFYNAYDAFAHQWGLHISPLQTKMDIVACDAYGSSHAMYAGQLALRKPILLGETNLFRTPDGEDGKGIIARMLLDQYFHGVQIQTFYAWNNFDADRFPYGMNHPDGKPLTGTLGASKVAEILAEIKDNIGILPAEAALIIPTRFLSRNADRHWIFQSPMNSVLGALDKYGIRSHIIYSDDISPSDYKGRDGEPVCLNDYKIIFALTDFGYDRAAYQSEILQDWVKNGGVLFMESLNRGAPEWTGIIEKPIASDSVYSSTRIPKFWRAKNKQARIEIAGSLESSISGSETLAVWDEIGDAAIFAAPHEDGWVIYAGTAIFGEMGDLEMQRLMWDALAYAGFSPPVIPIGLTYLKMGDTLYIKADSDWQGRAIIPSGYQVVEIKQYDINADEINPTINLEEDMLRGSLRKNEFCIIKLSQ